jgi:hypothetical protein
MSCLEDESDNWVKAIVVWSKYWNINDFILRNWGACVDTIFGTCQNDQSGLIGRRKVIVLRW